MVIVISTTLITAIFIGLIAGDIAGVLVEYVGVKNLVFGILKCAWFLFLLALVIGIPLLSLTVTFNSAARENIGLWPFLALAIVWPLSIIKINKKLKDKKDE